jgi:GNAT superfamily N-acetyltransferase
VRPPENGGLAVPHIIGQIGNEPKNLPMSLEYPLQEFPKEVTLKDGFKCKLRPLQEDDEKAFHEFFQTIPEHERMFIKHRVQDPAVIRNWCRTIDYGRNLPLVAVADGKIIGDATLHQQLGGWKRHVGRISVLVQPKYRGHGLGQLLVEEIVNIARDLGLEKAEAEFLGDQAAGIKLFSMVGFGHLMRLESYVKDMQAVPHDYLLMGMDLKTDEEYASPG